VRKKLLSSLLRGKLYVKAFRVRQGNGKGCAPKPLKEERLIYLEEHPTKEMAFTSLFGS